MADVLDMGKKFAVGYYYPRKDLKPFQQLIGKHLAKIDEVFFGWPGVPNARGYHENPDDTKQQIVGDLRWARDNGIKLDLLLNANCYGAAGANRIFLDGITRVLSELDGLGLMPEVVTTTNPVLAGMLKRNYPAVEVRASVNMEFGSTLAMEYVSHLFDSFYISYEIQRDLEQVKIFSQWCREHGKKLGLLANIGCLRNCPSHTFHNNLIAHSNPGEPDYSGDEPGVVLCEHLYRDRHFEEFIRGNWIRPEDLKYFAPYVSVIKLATRVVPNPDLIINAYLSEHYDGNLLNIIDPCFSIYFSPFYIDNNAFPDNWALSGIGAACAADCRHCGKCHEVLDQVMKLRRADYQLAAPSLQIRIPDGIGTSET